MFPGKIMRVWNDMFSLALNSSLIKKGILLLYLYLYCAVLWHFESSTAHFTFTVCVRSVARAEWRANSCFSIGWTIPFNVWISPEDFTRGSSWIISNVFTILCVETSVFAFLKLEIHRSLYIKLHTQQIHRFMIIKLWSHRSIVFFICTDTQFDERFL